MRGERLRRRLAGRSEPRAWSSFAAVRRSGAGRVHGRGKADVDFETTASWGVCGDDRVVGVDDGLDGRKAEPDTVSAGLGLRASRWKGWKRRVSSPGGMSRPVLVTERTACSPSVRVRLRFGRR